MIPVYAMIIFTITFCGAWTMVHRVSNSVPWRRLPLRMESPHHCGAHRTAMALTPMNRGWIAEKSPNCNDCWIGQIACEAGPLCDFHMSYENIQEAISIRLRSHYRVGGFLLAEIPDYGNFAWPDGDLFHLQLAGLTPILTHPERNRTLQADRLRMNGLAFARSSGPSYAVLSWGAWESMLSDGA